MIVDKKFEMNLLHENFESLDLVAAIQQALRMGDIASIESVRSDAFNSEVYFLRVKYRNKTDPQAPEKLVLKRNKDHWGEYESRFYALSSKTPDPIDSVPKCFFVGYDEKSGRSALLLQDVSDTHRPSVDRWTNIRGDATFENWEWDSILRSLAHFHSYRWESSHIGPPIFSSTMRHWFADRSSFEEHIARREGEFQIFESQVDGNDPEMQIDMLLEALGMLPSLWRPLNSERVSSLKNITVSQGDCYIGQFLIPKESNCPMAVLADFQEASGNFPSFDLGYLLSYFPPGNHSDTEDSLKRYHSFLDDAIRARYSFETLIEDYRLVLCLLIFVPVWDQSYGASEDYWRPKLRNVIRDFQNFRCMDFMRSIG